MQKRKIALVELYGHNEVLYILYRLLKYDFEISVLTTCKILQDAEDYFEEKLENWHAQSLTESKEQFVKKQFQLLNNQDIIIFITLVSSFRFFAKTAFQAKTIFLIHNVNTMLLSKEKRWINRTSLHFFSKDILRFLWSKIQRTNFHKRLLLEKMNYISYPSSTLTHYAKSITNQYDDKIIDPLPLCFYENYKVEKSNTIVISIPGVVLEEARNYEMVYEVFRKLRFKNEKTIQLQLLGSSNNDFGKKLISKFQKLENENFKLVFFLEPLSQKDFDCFLKKTDFMILPIRKYRKFGIVKEEYGKSNISGGLNDMIRFGIPAILFDAYKIEKWFEPLISTFTDQKELEEKLTDWIENSTYFEIRKKALPTLEKINEENTRNNLVKRIENLLN